MRSTTTATTTEEVDPDPLDPPPISASFNVALSSFPQTPGATDPAVSLNRRQPPT